MPDPSINVPLWDDFVWKCSVPALALSVAFGLMLFGLKLGIIDEHKRLNVLGAIGLGIVAFISISFNMDVLYRYADQEFFIRHSSARMRSVYEQFLAEAGRELTERRRTIRREVALQQGELEAEIDGLREAPAGYGQRAKKEDYRLTLLEKTAKVDLEQVDAALAVKEEADALLRESRPQTIADIQELQDRLRVAITGVAAQAHLPLPEPVRLESPLFAVFQKLFDFKSLGMKEIFFVLVAVFLDLGDIVGYSLVPNRPKRSNLAAALGAGGSDFIPPGGAYPPRQPLELPERAWDDQSGEPGAQDALEEEDDGPIRPIRFRRR